MAGTPRAIATCYSVRCLFGLLAIGALLLAGCDSDDDMELHLALAKTPETIANPPLASDLIPVTVGTNAQCIVTSINGVAVTQDPAN